MNNSNLEYVNGVMKNDKVVIKEDFCGACLALPLAFAGAGTATATAGGGGGSGKKLGGIFFWSVAVSVIGLVATIWFMSGNCKSCVSSPIKRGSIRKSSMSVCSSR